MRILNKFMTDQIGITQRGFLYDLLADAVVGYTSEELWEISGATKSDAEYRYILHLIYANKHEQLEEKVEQLKSRLERV